MMPLSRYSKSKETSFVNDSNEDRQPRLRDSTSPVSPEVVDQIVASLRGLRFGSLTIIVQDGVVVQIDRTEKRRMRKKSEP